MAKKEKRRLIDELHEKLKEIVSTQLVTEDFDYVRFEKRDGCIVSQGKRDVVINRFDTVKSYVKATHWFDDYWFYVSVNIQKAEDGVSEFPFVCVSFFQDIDDDLKPLFRADWDNYEEKIHPQPHWHFVSNEATTFDDLKQQSEVDDENPFAVLVREDKLKKLDFPAMHFAMAGNWHEDKKSKMITGYTQPQQLANWITNLFDHVRQELSYAFH